MTMLNSVGYHNALKAFDKASSSSGELHAAIGALTMWTIDNAVYVPTHLRPEEVVPREVFTMFGAKSYSLLDSRILWTADAIREWFGKPIVINNWHQGLIEILKLDTFDQRGFRLKPIGNATYSQHLFGRAIDFNIVGVSDEEVQHRIRVNAGKEAALRFVTRMEQNTVGWTHVDCMNTGTDTLTIFKGA